MFSKFTLATLQLLVVIGRWQASWSAKSSIHLDITECTLSQPTI